MKILVAVALAAAALATSSAPVSAQDVVPVSRNAAGQPACPSNFLLQGTVCVNVRAGRPGGPDSVPVGRNAAGQPTCPGNFSVQGNLCVSIYAKNVPPAGAAGVPGVPGVKGGGYDNRPSRESNRDDRGYRRDDDRGYRRDDDRGNRREGFNDREYRREYRRDDYDRGPPRGRASAEPYLSQRGEWVCPPGYFFRGNACLRGD